MQKQTQEQAIISSISADMRQPKWPVEIEFAQLQFVAGGAPKAGWYEPEAFEFTSESTQAPKAGW